MNDETEQPSADGATDWLTIARDAFTSSTDYMDANWRKTWERNIALFQSRHPDGSKYNSGAFKGRSRLFRPKTKSVVRKNEAAAAAAFFANVDVVSIEPENDSDPMQVASAAVMNELVNYRLTKTIPWYMTLLGALQEAQVIGIVASYQYWKYREQEQPPTYKAVLDDIGQPLMDGKGQQYFEEAPQPAKVLEDKPCIELIPAENIRFSPSANWTDVVGTSPYVIRMVPMYVDDVRQMMKANDPKTGSPKWTEYSEQEIRVAMVDYDSMRQARENNRQDPLAEGNASLGAFEIVWCHENFVRLDGKEMVYWTLGTQKMLTDPTPLAEVYFTGVRPIVVGCAILEAHKAVPESEVGIGYELQKELNETVNQRRDNVSLVLNKRYLVARNKNVDIDSLLRNVAGGVTMTDAPGDVQPLEWNDVTASSYAEQDRLNVDFDELTGNFSQGSVMTNRKLNETVGGMNLMGGAANQMTEYLLRTFVETWVEPVLRQLVKLEQAYETDQVVLGLAGERAKLAQSYGVNEVTDELLDQELTVRVSVGMGATDPQQKLGRLIAVLKAYADTVATIPDADPEAIRNELFGMAGYKGAARFFKAADKGGPNPMQAQMAKMQQEIQGLMQQLQATQMQLRDKSAETRVKQFDAETKRLALMPAQQGDPLELMKAMISEQLAAADIDLKQAQTLKTLIEAFAQPSPGMEYEAAHVG